MGTIFLIAAVVCVFGIAVSSVFAAMRWAWRRGYRRCKAGFTIGRSGFYIEADDLARTVPDPKEGRR